VPAVPTQQQLQVPVQGMTCRACEVRVGKALRRVPGVLDAEVSVRAGRATLTVDPAVRSDRLQSDVEAAVRKAGYDVGRAPWLSADVEVWKQAVLAIAVVGSLAVLLWWFGVPDLVGGSVEAGGLAVVLLVGLAAGVSTCMALVGGLVLAVSASYAASVSYEDGSPRRTGWRPQLAFQAGRIVGFVILGGVLGAVGARLSLPERATAVLTLAVALVMVVLGLRLLRISPRMSAWSPTLPPSMARALGVEDRAGRPYSDTRTAVLGALTFFLPCGFTQAMQLYAMTTGSALAGAAVMGVFALGTAPGLLALGGLPALASGRARDQVLAITGAVLVAFAVVNASGVAGIFGWTADRSDEVPVALTSNVTVSGSLQTVSMDQTTRGYAPETSVVQAGVPIRWEITSVSDLSCAAYLRGVTDPEFRVDLATGPNVVELPALAPGRWDFSCAMGMYSGTLIAIDQPTS